MKLPPCDSYPQAPPPGGGQNHHEQCFLISRQRLAVSHQLYACRNLYSAGGTSSIEGISRRRFTDSTTRPRQYSISSSVLKRPRPNRSGVFATSSETPRAFRSEEHTSEL